MMASGSEERAETDADNGEGASSSSSSFTPGTSAAISSATIAPSSPRMPSTPTAMTPLITPASSPPPGKARFQIPIPGVEVDRPWMRSELLSPSRFSGQFFDEGPSPYNLADLEAPRPLYARSFSDTSSMSSRFSLLPDPSTWGSAMDAAVAEPDDELHTPDPDRDKTIDKGGTICTPRGMLNLGCLIVLLASLFALFAAWPIAYHFTHRHPSDLSNISTNSTGQVPVGAVHRSEWNALRGR
ncbi:hypothetical protein ACEPAG_2929 [Sanghuangporus baumii]